MSGFMGTYGVAAVFFAIGIYNVVTCVAAYFRTGDSHYFIGVIVGLIWIGGGVFFAVRGRRRRIRIEQEGEAAAAVPGSAWRFLLHSRIERQWLAIVIVILICLILAALVLSAHRDLSQLRPVVLAARLTGDFLFLYVPSGLISLGIYTFRKLRKSVNGYPHFLHGAIAIAEGCLMYFGGAQH